MNLPTVNFGNSPRTGRRACGSHAVAAIVGARLQPVGLRPSSSVPSESRRLAAHESTAGRTAGQLGGLGFVLLRSAAVLP